MLCWQTLQGLHLVCRNEAVEEHVWHHGEEQGHTASQREGCYRLFPLSGQYRRLFYHLLQCQHGQQGDGELGDDENGGDGAELSVHRHVVDEEVCQAHEVLSPRQHDAEDSGRQ